MSQLFPHLAYKNSYLGEYVALYAIRDMLLNSKESEFVGFCHYRRITMTKQYGELRRMNIHAHPCLIQTMDLKDFYWDGKTPIIPATAPLMFSILQHYSICGLNCRDLLLYFASAVDCGIITSEEAAAFLSSNLLIPAPTVSFLPTQIFINIVNSLELINEYFYRNHYIQQMGYSERAMAFCCERLHSLLLSKIAMHWAPGTYFAQPSTIFSLDDGFEFQRNASIATTQ